MRGTIWALALVTLATAVPVIAQEPSPDSAPARPRLEELRRRVRERYAERIQQELGLTGDQMTRLRATTSTFAGRRREMEDRQRELRAALAGQLRPGIAASPDSVARLTDELMAVRVRYAESFRTEQAELARYLDPIQRAKFTVLRERLLNQAQEFRRRRRFMDR